MDLVPVNVDRVIANTKDEFAVVLVGGGKTFLIFVGNAEAFAIFRELQGARPRRPLTHDLLVNVLQGLDVRVKRVVVSSIVASTFCATLFLEQDAAEDSTTRREVRLDLRASDAMILALKSGTQLHATESVIEQVEDVSELLGAAGESEGEAFGGELGL